MKLKELEEKLIEKAKQQLKDSQLEGTWSIIRLVKLDGQGEDAKYYVAVVFKQKDARRIPQTFFLTIKGDDEL